MSVSYNVQHAPFGAFASFTLGSIGRKGGFSSQVGRPGDSNIYIGYVDESGDVRCLPFFEGADDPLRQPSVASADPSKPLTTFKAEEIRRELRWASDTLEAGRLTLTFLSPFGPVVEPRTASPGELADRSCPAIMACLVVDNTDGAKALTAFFALDAPSLRDLETTSDGQLIGIAHRRRWGLACRPQPGVRAFLSFSLVEALKRPADLLFRLGKVGGLLIDVPPGARAEVWIALGFFEPGVQTTGLPARYLYARYFDGLEAVLGSALDRREAIAREARARDEELSRSSLSASQQWLLAQATHSYLGSTQWMDKSLNDASPVASLWVVNEGEYEMINTFDLTIDHLFFELRYVPWAVRDVLDLYLDRYSYRDEVKAPGARDTLLPGGISFCHDMGVSNHFAPAGNSSYERPDLDAACFSYMTHEQLTNWICCAGVYVARTGDEEFLGRHRALLADLLTSLLHRDAAREDDRTGVMGLDSSRCGSGAEITTYDSLDSSLGRARSNLYLAGKTWASYCILEHLFGRTGDHARAKEAGAGGARCARAIRGAFRDELGYIPALLDGESKSAIIPAIEGLVYPHAMGLACASEEGEHGELVRALRRHLQAVLQPGVCLFSDGGWKLSSSSDNSWMSKIALCQHIARAVLNVDLPDPEHHDAAHVRWQIEGSGYWAFSDQMLHGHAIGSRYYPRGVTAVLWLEAQPAAAR